MQILIQLDLISKSSHDISDLFTALSFSEIEKRKLIVSLVDIYGKSTRYLGWNCIVHYWSKRLERFSFECREVIELLSDLVVLKGPCQNSMLILILFT